jgi:hypothetical protein
MPRATVDTTPKRYDLESLPEGFVTLRRMPFGDWLHRQELALRLQMQQEMGKRKGQAADMKAEMQMANKAVTVFEFRKCMVDHNLEDEQGNKLDFSGPVALEQLDPRVGNEIGQLISELHEFDLGNSQTVSDTPSEAVETVE